VLTQQPVVGLLQQLPEGRQVCLPAAAAGMSPHQVEPTGLQQLLLPQCLQLSADDQLWADPRVRTGGQFMLIFTEAFLRYRHNLPTSFGAHSTAAASAAAAGAAA